jgi:hypothetical protein
MVSMTISAFVRSPVITPAPVLPDTDMYEADSRIFTPEDMDEYSRWLAETAVGELHA